MTCRTHHPDPSRLVPLGEAARLVGVSHLEIRRAVRSGELQTLPALHLGQEIRLVEPAALALAYPGTALESHGGLDAEARGIEWIGTSPDDVPPQRRTEVPDPTPPEERSSRPSLPEAAPVVALDEGTPVAQESLDPPEDAGEVPSQPVAALSAGRRGAAPVESEVRPVGAAGPGTGSSRGSASPAAVQVTPTARPVGEQALSPRGPERADAPRMSAVSDVPPRADAPAPVVERQKVVLPEPDPVEDRPGNPRVQVPVDGETTWAEVERAPLDGAVAQWERRRARRSKVARWTLTAWALALVGTWAWVEYPSEVQAAFEGIQEWARSGQVSRSEASRKGALTSVLADESVDPDDGEGLVVQEVSGPGSLGSDGTETEIEAPSESAPEGAEGAQDSPVIVESPGDRTAVSPRGTVGEPGPGSVRPRADGAVEDSMGSLEPGAVSETPSEPSTPEREPVLGSDQELGPPSDPRPSTNLSPSPAEPEPAPALPDRLREEATRVSATPPSVRLVAEEDEPVRPPAPVRVRGQVQSKWQAPLAASAKGHPCAWWATTSPGAPLASVLGPCRGPWDDSKGHVVGQHRSGRVHLCSHHLRFVADLGGDLAEEQETARRAQEEGLPAPLLRMRVNSTARSLLRERLGPWVESGFERGEGHELTDLGEGRWRIQTWIRQSGEDPKRQAVMMEVVLQDGPHADGLAGVVVQRP